MIIRTLSVITLTTGYLILTGCTLTTPPRIESSEANTISSSTVPVKSASIRAQGNEPGWQLIIENKTLSFISDYGQQRTILPLSNTAGLNSSQYYTASDGQHTITAIITNRLCHDDMSGMPYPATASITKDGQTLNGCSGDPATLLQNKTWVVEDINRGGIIDRSRVTIEFGENGSLKGMASCNTYSSTYALSGEGLTVGSLSQTEKSCAPSLMHQEEKFTNILKKIQRFDFSQTGALMLYTNNDQTIKAREETIRSTPAN